MKKITIYFFCLFYLSQVLIYFQEISKSLHLRNLQGWHETSVDNKSWERRWDPSSRYYPISDRGTTKLQISIRR